MTFFFFFGDVIAVTNFSGKNLVPPQIGLSSYAHDHKYKQESGAPIGKIGLPLNRFFFIVKATIILPLQSVLILYNPCSLTSINNNLWQDPLLALPVMITISCTGIVKVRKIH